jgi:cobalt-zinc-cadmium efflux system protein
MGLAGVEAVHDLHVWTITSGLDAMSCHLVVDDTAVYRTTLQAAHDMMRDEFGISKTTIQIEHEGLHAVADEGGHDHDH